MWRGQAWTASDRINCLSTRPLTPVEPWRAPAVQTGATPSRLQGVVTTSGNASTATFTCSCCWRCVDLHRCSQCGRPAAALNIEQGRSRCTGTLSSYLLRDRSPSLSFAGSLHNVECTPDALLCINSSSTVALHLRCTASNVGPCATPAFVQRCSPACLTPCRALPISLAARARHAFDARRGPVAVEGLRDQHEPQRAGHHAQGADGRRA